MKVCIDSRLLGSKRHMIVTDGRPEWSDAVPEDAWHLDGSLKDSDRCLDTVHLLESVTVPVEVPMKYQEAARSALGESYGTVDIPWRHFMPTDDHQAFMKKVLHDVVGCHDGLSFEYFLRVWRPTRAVFQALRPSCIDTHTLETLLSNEKCESQRSSLQSFRPSLGTFVDPPSYARTATKTGRLTVSSGPQILTIKKENRSVVKSAYTDGSIVSFDFRALEARIVYMEEHDSLDSNDVYTYINQRHFKGVLPRDVIKSAVLCELYGMSAGSLASKLNTSIDRAEKFMEKIRVLFETDRIIAHLRSEFIDDGFIRNRFGRKLKVPELRLLLNYYTQSTGVDVSLLGFTNVIERLGQISPDIRPLMIVHDDLMVDCPSYLIEKVMSVESVDVPGYRDPFPLSPKILTAVHHAA